MSDYRLRVDRHDWKCCTPDGEWDGTYDESYGYEIVDWETNVPVSIQDGFKTEKQAREAGEKALERWRSIWIGRTGEIGYPLLKESRTTRTICRLFYRLWRKKYEMA